MSEETLNPKRRRSYTPQFKAEMVAQCVQSNVSLASLAVEHGMNPNVLHRWVTEHERYGRHSVTGDSPAIKPSSLAVRTSLPASSLISIPVPSSPSVNDSQDCIRLEVTQGTTRVSLSWPINGASQCAAFLREWLR